MTEQEARFILQSYRPGGEDKDDPQFAEALREAERNPELARWLAEEQAFDCAVAAQLAALPAPFGLKTRILAQAAPRSGRTSMESGGDPGGRCRTALPGRASRWSVPAGRASPGACVSVGGDSRLRAGDGELHSAQSATGNEEPRPGGDQGLVGEGRVADGSPAGSRRARATRLPSPLVSGSRGGLDLLPAGRRPAGASLRGESSGDAENEAG